MRTWLVGVALLVLLSGARPAAPARVARAGIPILITSGDTIADVGALEGGRPSGGPRIGYKYSYFGVFWLDVWTWGGTYCVYEGKSFQPLTEEEAVKLSAKKSVRHPFLYSFPLLLVGILGFVGFVAAGLVFNIGGRKPGSNQPLGDLSQDPKYRAALRIMLGKDGTAGVGAAPAAGEATLGDPEMKPSAAATPGQQRYEAAIHSLVLSGIPREEAVRNLGRLVKDPRPAAKPAAS